MSISEKRKLDYFDRLLDEDDTLRINFIKYFQTEFEQLRMASTPAFSIEEALARIKAQAREVSEVLSGLDFEETDWESWEGSNHYMKSWEIAQQLAEGEADEVWENCNFGLVDLIERGDLTGIVVECSTIYLGIEQAEINDPNYDLGDDANDYFFSALSQTIKENLHSLEGRPFAIGDFKNACNLFVSFNNLYFKDANEFVDSVAPVFLAAIQSKNQAEILWEAGKSLGGDSYLPPGLLNKVTKLLGDTSLWVDSLESCFLEDFNASKDLLDHYYENNKEKFEEETIKFETKFGHSTHVYLIEKLKPGTPFHIEVLGKHAQYTGSTDDLELLKKHIDAEELARYIDSLYDKDTKALFLVHEKAFDKLIALIEETSQKGSSYYSGLDFEGAISLLIKDRPAEAWRLTKQKVNSVLMNQRGRDVYASVVRWLKLAQDKLGNESDISVFIMETYNHKPNLPALKDEMRQAGLIRL
jgi:hypothetical protein